MDNMDKNSTLHDRVTVHEASVPIPGDKIKLAIEKNRIRRGLYIAGGTISLALAILGIVVPGLPVTPLALLSAVLYAKSSEKLYNRLLNNKLLGPRIRNYQRRKGVTRRGKMGVIAFMTLMVLFSAFVVIQHIPLRMVVLSLGVVGLIVVWFFVPTAQDDPVKSTDRDDPLSS